MSTPAKSQALDHMVVVFFENRSLDNVLGRLYGPEDDMTFDGVIGKDLFPNGLSMEPTARWSRTP